jgi:EAL domain-containing protein (putative c-di-GMP-specific phosphodiesterase class I)
VRSQLAKQNIPVSLGLTELRPGHTPSDLREEADAALYEAKRNGGDRSVSFSDIASGVSMTTTARTAALDALLASGDLEVAFQPIWNLQRRSLLGVEALARPHRRHAFAGPADAFDAAQQLGRLYELDVLCVTRILQRSSELPGDALLFINVSPQTLDRHTDPWLERLVAAAELDPARIVIEVTERVGGRTELVIQTLRRLRERGFAIAIDDVGTGNSGLQMLADANADYIKLDRSIVAGALTDPSARAILVAMAAYAHHTGAFVIAEGIEDEEILQLIVNLGSSAGTATITGGQGYGLGRPNTQTSERMLDEPPEILDPGRNARPYAGHTQ